MRKLFIMGLISAGLLAGCVSPADNSLYRKVMINGEVLTDRTNDYGVTITQVKYDGRLFRCSTEGGGICTEM